MKLAYNLKSNFGWTNCNSCDKDITYDEHFREVVLAIWLCKKCEDINHL